MDTTRLRAICLGTTLLLSGPLVKAAAADPPPTGNARAAWLERVTEARQGREESDQVVRVFSVGERGALDLSNVAGDVRISASRGGDIRIEATRRARHADATEARRALEQLRVEMTQVGSRVEVRTSYPRPDRTGGRGARARVDYVVTVPAATTVTVRTLSGNAAISGVSGEVRAEAVSGDVSVSAATNLSLARTVSGNVTARDVGGTFGLTLGTVSGSIRATGLRARGIECSSVSGDVTLADVEVERLQAKSVSGSLVFGGPLARGGRYEFGTHSGDVRVTLASDTGFELDASTFSGSVRSEVPVTLSPGTRDDRRQRTQAIRGVHGDGSAVLAIKTFSGTVVIGRQ